MSSMSQREGWHSQERTGPGPGAWMLFPAGRAQVTCKVDAPWSQRFRACRWTGRLLHSIHSIHSSNPVQKINTIRTKTYGQVFSLIFVFGETGVLGWAQANWEPKEWLKTKQNHNTMYHSSTPTEGSLPLGSGAVYFVKSPCEVSAQL